MLAVPICAVSSSGILQWGPGITSQLAHCPSTYPCLPSPEVLVSHNKLIKRNHAKLTLNLRHSLKRQLSGRAAECTVYRKGSQCPRTVPDLLWQQLAMRKLSQDVPALGMLCFLLINYQAHMHIPAHGMRWPAFDSSLQGDVTCKTIRQSLRCLTLRGRTQAELVMLCPKILQSKSWADSNLSMMAQGEGPSVSAWHTESSSFSPSHLHLKFLRWTVMSKTPAR